MPKKNPVKYVIARYAEPRQPGPGLAGGYVGEDGMPTDRSRAAEFWSGDEARRFAESHHIELDGALHYITVKSWK
jgi:hypothetical protein